LPLAHKTNQPVKGIAEKILALTKNNPHLQGEITPRGYLNFRLTDNYYYQFLKNIVTGKLFPGGREIGLSAQPKNSVLLEYVSTNPTGYLHLAHFRHAFVGNALANVYQFCGYQAIKEYYINDRGGQITSLINSIYYFYHQLQGVSLPAELEKIEYSEILKLILTKIRQDLEKCGVKFDVWFSETSLYEKNKHQELLVELKKKNLIYTQGGATFFRSSLNGADHHGSIARLKSAWQLLGYEPEDLQIILVQIVNLLTKEGQAERFSKRAGNTIELAEALKYMEIEQLKFFLLEKENNQPLAINVELLKENKEKTRLYYTQYAYAPQVFQTYYQKETIIEEKNLPKTQQRLLLTHGVKVILKTGLNLAGITAPERIEFQEKIGNSENFSERFEELSSLARIVRKISESIEEVKRLMNGQDTQEILNYSSPAEAEIYQNWLNYLYKIELVSVPIGLNEWGTANDSFWDGMSDKLYSLHRKKIIKETSEAIANSCNPDALTAFLNEEAERDHFRSEEFCKRPFPTQDITWQDWLNVKRDNLSAILTKKEKIDKFLEEYIGKDEESIAAAKNKVKKRLENDFSATKENYEILGLPETASEEEIKKAYRKLSVKLHPDRGGDAEKFKEMDNAYKQIMGGGKEKRKYDFCLVEDLDRFGEQIGLIIQEELDDKELTVEDLTDYNEFHRRDEEELEFPELRDEKGEFKPVADFVASLGGTYQYQAIELTRKYLEVINDAQSAFITILKLKKMFGIEKTDYERFKEMLKGKKDQLELTERELTEPGQINCVRAYKKLEIEKYKIGPNEKEKKARMDKQLGRLYGGVVGRIGEIRKAKVKLLEELNEKIEKGRGLEESKEENLQFLTEFENFLTSLQEATSYEVEIQTMIIDGKKTVESERFRKVDGELKFVIETKEQLKDIRDKEEEIDQEDIIETLPDFSSETSEPITQEEKQAIIEYLNDLVFVLAPKNRQLKRKVEDIRDKAIKNICEMIKGGGSDEVLTKRIEAILKDFALILEKEIETKREIELSPEQKNLLVVDMVGEINNSARKLTESKRKILSFLANNTQNEKTGEDSENERIERERIEREANERAEAERVERERLAAEAEKSNETKAEDTSTLQPQQTVQPNNTASDSTSGTNSSSSSSNSSSPSSSS
ncbi:755_t:CDS:2, partial [Entrophospora sp. SA101]